MALRRSQREQTRKYATGKKVYRQGSTAPTRGTVKPGGYIKREMKKRGTMQNSQTRSGLAQQALRRTLRQDIAQNRFGTNPNDLNRQQKQVLRNRVGNRMEKIGGNASNLRPENREDYHNIFNRLSGGITGGITRTPVRNQPPTSNGGNQPQQDQGVPMNSMPVGQPQTMNVNMNGQLDLPYDQNFAWDLLGQKQAMNQQLLELQEAEQNQALDFDVLKRNAGKQFQENQRDALNNAAGRGMAFSSMYGKDVAENANNYNTFLNDLNTRNSLFKSQMENRRSAIANALDEFLRQSALQQAIRLEDDAGDLGFDTTPIEPSYNDTAPESWPNNPGGQKPQRPSIPKAAPKLREDALRTALRRQIIENRGLTPGELTKKQRQRVSNTVDRRYKANDGSPRKVADNVQKRYSRIVKKRKK